MPEDAEKLYLLTRLEMAEDALAELLVHSGVPVEMVAAWRGWTRHRGSPGNHTYLHGTMNAIVHKLGRKSWVHRPEPVQVPTSGRSSKGSHRTMCGRARLSLDFSQIRMALKLSPDAPSLNLRPSWNIAPTQDMLIVADRPGVGRIARLAKWGLIPSWSKEPKAMGATFNARSDTFREKPTFRNAWAKGRRCLVVVDGFYEWQKDDKWPVAIARQDGKPMTFGGLWERWAKEGAEEVYSCTILTLDAGPAMSLIHDREPLILEEKDWPVWLGEEPGDLDALIKPVPLDTLCYWKVSKEVGNVKNNGPALIEKVGR